MSKKIKCKNCGKEHAETLANCCWINCECGKEICGQCGGTNIVKKQNIDDSPDGDDQYWCCMECADCGLVGCAMCI